jgi:hypothetical protein
VERQRAQIRERHTAARVAAAYEQAYDRLLAR